MDRSAVRRVHETAPGRQGRLDLEITDLLVPASRAGSRLQGDDAAIVGTRDQVAPDEDRHDVHLADIGSPRELRLA
jgi:hypothetical protein